uniref:Uncharacterized protein n=1 Tax=Anguilla anguilla TaxID=7936 RepID=A0A0E9R5J5_ANGAN
MGRSRDAGSLLELTLLTAVLSWSLHQSSWYSWRHRHCRC